MAQDGYPPDPVTWRQYEAIERDAIGRAAASTFTTPGAARQYRQRYPAHAERITVLENGYDEESFRGVGVPAAAGALTPGATTLLHSGIVYPAERDPAHLFQAVAQLHRDGRITPSTLRLRFRAAVHDAAAAAAGSRRRRVRVPGMLPADRLPCRAARDDACRRPAGAAGRQLQRTDPRQVVRIPARAAPHRGADRPRWRHRRRAAACAPRHHRTARRRRRHRAAAAGAGDRRAARCNRRRRRHRARVACRAQRRAGCAVRQRQRLERATASPSRRGKRPAERDRRSASRVLPTARRHRAALHRVPQQHPCHPRVLRKPRCCWAPPGPSAAAGR